MAKSILRAAIEGDELVLRIGVDVLAHAARTGNGIEPGIQVKDERAYAEWVAAHLIEFGQDSAGVSAQERVFDALAVEAVESAQDFVAEFSEGRSS